MSNRPALIKPADGNSIQVSVPVTRYVPVIVEPIGDNKPYWVDGQLMFQWHGNMDGVGPFNWFLDVFDSERRGLCKLTYL